MLHLYLTPVLETASVDVLETPIGITSVMNILMSYRSGYNSSFTATTKKERETEFRLYM